MKRLLIITILCIFTIYCKPTVAVDNPYTWLHTLEIKVSDTHNAWSQSDTIYLFLIKEAAEARYLEEMYSHYVAWAISEGAVGWQEIFTASMNECRIRAEVAERMAAAELEKSIVLYALYKAALQEYWLFSSSLLMR